MSQAEGTKPTVTEDSLVKSLAELAGKTVEVVSTSAPAAIVQPLTKTATDTVMDLGSESLKKALDVSEVLDEAIALMGVHVDRSLESMNKSLEASAQRDVAIVDVLVSLKKSLDENTATVQKLLDAPAGSAGTRPVTTSSGEVLTKTVGAGGSTEGKNTELNPGDLKKSILDGLETLVKSEKVTTSEGSRLSSALIKFESTGQISDTDMAAALKASKS